MINRLLHKYDLNGPRYTSYPAVPHWSQQDPSPEIWKKKVINSFGKYNKETGISIYCHLPYCESLCTYCGCNTRITKNHAVENPYIKALLNEWKMYIDLFDEKPIIKEIHLGGGTPTFFNPSNLKNLISQIIKNAVVPVNKEFGFEAHPENTTFDHLKTLYDLGFTRLSLGVQDFDKKVLQGINRSQSFESVQKLTLQARQLGYTSINYDLVYGLPFQNRKCIIDTLRKIKQLSPDRIAFYSYAHVPWKSPGQRKFTENDLPPTVEKMELYKIGRNMLKEIGYYEIGMDHFSLYEDSLYKAANMKKLHRNFMGYTTSNTKLLIGLGASSISDTWDAYMQNQKNVEDYLKSVSINDFPILKGHILNKEELIIRKHILNIMCNYETNWIDDKMQCAGIDKNMDNLLKLEKDGLINTTPFGFKVMKAGMPFLRNICMGIDPFMQENEVFSNTFSKTV